MSAWIVDRGHIRFLIEAGLRLDKDFPLRWGERELTRANASEVGLMLWEECRKSVAFRYAPDPDEELPGPCDDGPRFGYVHQPMPGVKLNMVQVLRAIDCYCYQSCEHPEWKASEAHEFCQCLRARAISKLPGYDKAEWGCPPGWETERPEQSDIEVARQRKLVLVMVS